MSAATANSILRLSGTKLVWLGWGLTAAFILRSRPFMKLPYDIWHHLMLIRGWFQDGAPILTMPGTTYHEVLWHRIWAELFLLLGISDVFLWAKIIHVIQFSWTIYCLYFFTSTVLQLWDPKLSSEKRSLAALFGAWCFILGAGTFSVQFQLSWILWYSVNYQGFTLPAFFLATASLLQILGNAPGSRHALVIRGIRMLLLFILIIALHPLEGAYFLIVLVISTMIFWRRIWRLIKSNPMTVLMLISPLAIGPLLLHYLPQLGIPLPKSGGLSQILQSPMAVWKRALVQGSVIQAGNLHRGLSTYTEAAIGGTLLIIGFVCGALWSHFSNRRPNPSKDHADTLSLNTIIWVGVTAAGFALFPRTLIPSGLLAVLTSTSQVSRFTFASTWFTGYAIFFAWVIRSKITRRLVLIACLPLLIVFFYSRFYLSGPFNTNAASVFRSLEIREKDSVGIQLPSSDLDKIVTRVKSAPTPPTGKTNLFLVRPDLMSFVRASTGAYVLGNRLIPPGRSTVEKMRYDDRYQLIAINSVDIFVDRDLMTFFPALAEPANSEHLR